MTTSASESMKALNDNLKKIAKKKEKEEEKNSALTNTENGGQQNSKPNTTYEFRQLEDNKVAESNLQPAQKKSGSEPTTTASAPNGSKKVAKVASEKKSDKNAELKALMAEPDLFGFGKKVTNYYQLYGLDEDEEKEDSKANTTYGFRQLEDNKVAESKKQSEETNPIRLWTTLMDQPDDITSTNRGKSIQDKVPKRQNKQYEKQVPSLYGSLPYRWDRNDSDQSKKANSGGVVQSDGIVPPLLVARLPKIELKGADQSINANNGSVPGVFDSVQNRMMARLPKIENNTGNLFGTMQGNPLENPLNLRYNENNNKKVVKISADNSDDSNGLDHDMYLPQYNPNDSVWDKIKKIVQAFLVVQAKKKTANETGNEYDPTNSGNPFEAIAGAFGPRMNSAGKYLRKTGNQIIGGNYTDDNTALGTAAQVALGFTDLDIPMDARDLFHDVTNWKSTPEHIGRTLLDGVGFLPAIGTLKYSDQAAELLEGAVKHIDGFTDTAKAAKRFDNAADTTKTAVKKAEDFGEGAGKVVSEIKFKPSSGVILKATPGKTTTVLGSYDKDMKSIVGELGNVKSTDFGSNDGGFNVLNVPDELYDKETFWNLYNKPWLDHAIERGDDIVLATTPKSNLLMDFDEKSGKYVDPGFGKEYYYLIDHGYIYNASTNRMLLK